MSARGTAAGRGLRRYEVRHRTTYTYTEAVTASYGWAYLTPRPVFGQTCRESLVTVRPTAAQSSAQLDFYGNRATYFEVHEPHAELTVTATSQVDVSRAAADLASLDDWRWERAAAGVRQRQEDEEVEFLLPSPRVPAGGGHPGVRALTAQVFRPGRPLGEALAALVHEIHRRFRYRTGATSVTTPLAEVMESGEGVCQDFAHLAVAVARLAGLPARYVSGYLETQPPPGRPRLVGADASHAWASVLVPEVGWIDLDPTNDQVVDDRYVVTAWGRDYSDVPPLKGVIFTESPTSTLEVAVDVIPLD